MTIFTIGVYESSEEQFFDKLLNNGVDTLCDIRQRRGVRGSTYAFVNSTVLQERLAQIGIRYIYLRSLAPTKEIREKQWAEDKRLGESKHDRTRISRLFEASYRHDIMNLFDFDAFYQDMQRQGAQRIAFLCIEANACACHRSLVAEEMRKRYGCEIIDL